MKRPLAVLTVAILCPATCWGQNGALQFDGVDDGVEVPNPMATAGQRFTWEGWVQPGSGLYSAPIYFHRAHYSDKTLFIRIEQPGECQFHFFLFESVATGGMRERTVLATRAFSPGDWFHVAGTYDGEYMKLYVNGELAGQSEEPEYDGYLKWTDRVYSSYIGGKIYQESAVGWITYLHGSMDEVRVWDVARSQEEISRNMGLHIAGPQPALLACYPFDDGEGQVASDVSGNGKDGHLGRIPDADGADPQWTASTAPINYIEVVSVEPQPCPTAGSVVTVQGIRFLSPQETTVTLGGAVVVPLSLSNDRIQFLAPPAPDGEPSLEVRNEFGTSTTVFVYRSEFLRADANGDGRVDVSDPVTILNHLFLGGDIDCGDAADANDDGGFDISDAISLLGFLFLGTNRPPEPFLNVGVDPSEDGLRCTRTRPSPG